MAFQHIRIKNTSVSGKVPTADKIDVAELCVNLKDRKLYSKDADDNIFELGGGGAQVPGGNTPPPSGNEIGDLFFDTTLNQLLYWDGTAWVPISGDEVQNLDDLKDVVITNPQDGELLVWNGSNWVNSDPGYVTDVELNNILEGKFPDGTPNPDAEEYLKAGDDVSELVNDAGYLTEETLTDGIEDGTVELPFIPTESWADITAVDEAEDADYIAINRGDVVYKITAEDLGAIGSKPVFPQPDEIVSTPNFQDGTGTELDPYILTPITVRPAGASGQTVEYITIDVPGSSPGQLVSWTDNSTGADARFAQPAGVTGVDGTWSGRLVYNDIPATTDDQDYTGDIQIGNVYFQWVVSQGVEATRPINPNPNEITSNPPFESGTGTNVDPYVLRTITVAPAGGTGQTQELLTIAEFGAVQGETVRWIDNSVGVGNRFVQPEGVVGPDGTWSGRLFYTDDPNSTVDVDYTGNLQIGATSVYFLWTVEQKISAALAPTIENITLIEADPEGDRFTSQSFVASVSMEEEGLPISTKTFTATVTGDITTEVQFIEPLESSGSALSTQYSDALENHTSVGSWSATYPKSNGFDGDIFTYGLSGGSVNNTCGWEVPPELQSEGSWALYQPAPSAVVAVDYIDINDSYKVLGNLTADGQGKVSLGNIAAKVIYWTCNQNGTYTGISAFEKDGVIITNPDITALTFAAGTDMDALAPGDNISQPVNFTEPLESTTAPPNQPNYPDSLLLPTSSVNFTAAEYSAALDGSTSTVVVAYATGSGNQINIDVSGIPLKGKKVEMWVDNSGQNPDSMRPRWQTKGGIYYKTSTTPSGANWVTLVPDNDASQTVFSDDCNYVAMMGWGGSGQGTPKFSAFRVDGKLFGRGLPGLGPDSLVFAADTDMAALAPGDVVSQDGVGQLTSPAGSFDPNAPASNAFDGLTTTDAYVPVNDAVIDWILPSNLNLSGVLLEIYSRSRDFDIDVYSGSTVINSLSFTSNASTWRGLTINGGRPDRIRIACSSNFPQLSAIRIDGIPLVGTLGTVGSITGTTATLSSSTGTWVDGADVTTGDKLTTGTVGSITDTTVSLSSSTGAWVDDTDVTGPKKVISLTNTTKYLEFNSNGDVLKLLSAPQEPAYTTQDTDPQLTLKFPAVFPSGEAPDTELGEGTVLNVCVEASNTAGSDGPECDEVQPEEAGGFDVALGGLTTLYSGTNSPLSIVNGINLVDNDGLVWIKNRALDGWHWLYDTLRGTDSVLFSNEPTDAQAVPSLASFDDKGFSLAGDAQSNSVGSYYVAWTFGKAAGYFDLIKYRGDNDLNRVIPHQLAAKPGFIIWKATNLSNEWFCYSSALPLTGADPGNFDIPDTFLKLNTYEAAYVDGGRLKGRPDENNIYVSNDNQVNKTGTDYACYLFAEDTPDVIKCGSYMGAGAGTTVGVGFKPQWILVRRYNAPGDDWIIIDSARGTEPEARALQANDDTAERADSKWSTSFTDTGFKFNAIDNGLSASGQLYIYVAIAAPPIARSMTQDEFTSQDLKFQTYNYREAEYQQDLVRQRSELIDNLEQQGYTSAQILEALE